MFLQTGDKQSANQFPEGSTCAVVQGGGNVPDWSAEAGSTLGKPAASPPPTLQHHLAAPSRMQHHW